MEDEEEGKESKRLVGLDADLTKEVPGQFIRNLSKNCFHQFLESGSPHPNPNYHESNNDRDTD
jgi:hypothetical protein